MNAVVNVVHWEMIMQIQDLFTSWNAEKPASEIALIACTDYLSVALPHASTTFYNLLKTATN
jgi:hypothetical protein